jgi:hypothetical protein
MDSPGHLEEKAGVSKLENIDSGLYDPDAGLSDEERAAIVNTPFPYWSQRSD